MKANEEFIDRCGTKTTSRDGGVRRKRNVRFSDVEWVWVAERAADRAMTVASYLRSLALRGMPAENPTGNYTD